MRGGTDGQKAGIRQAGRVIPSNEAQTAALAEANAEGAAKGDRAV
jgi:hypothetical protein